jgi:hypothetical protein
LPHPVSDDAQLHHPLRCCHRRPPACVGGGDIGVLPPSLRVKP